MALSKTLPKYVKMEKDGYKSVLRLVPGGYSSYATTLYIKDAGNWHVYPVWKDGKLMSKSPYKEHPQLNGYELKKATKKEWEEDNAGYL